MRVANKMVYDMVKTNLGKITEDLNRANQVVSTGRTINRLSDDPVGLTQVLRLHSSLDNLEQFGRNIALGKSWLTSAESALNNAADLLSEAKALCVQMASATTGASERAAAAETVQHMLDEIVSLANTDVGGRYIFAGLDTENPPFQSDGTYTGNDTAFCIRIGTNTSLAVGRDGEEVFGNAFTTLSDLKTALQTDNIPGIQSAMTDLDRDFAHITTKISDCGSKQFRLEIKEKIYKGLEITNKERASLIEEADIAEAIMELKGMEFAYNAALSSSATVIRTSLVDFL